MAIFLYKWKGYLLPSRKTDLFTPYFEGLMDLKPSKQVISLCLFCVRQCV